MIQLYADHHLPALSRRLMLDTNWRTNGSAAASATCVLKVFAVLSLSPSPGCTHQSSQEASKRLTFLAHCAPGFPVRPWSKFGARKACLVNTGGSKSAFISQITPSRHSNPCDMGIYVCLEIGNCCCGIANSNHEDGAPSILIYKYASRMVSI